MRKIETEILVIGGGATGTGTIRDLAMRGYKAILVEKRDFSHGTTGRYHGLLHSGGRYVVKDPLAAAECIAENQILRRIMPHCIEDTGGYFVLTPWDDPNYVPAFLEGCWRAGIPVNEIAIKQMLRAEPLLNTAILRCFHVPDAAADSFLATEANVASARAYGAQVFNYLEVQELKRVGNRVVGVRCYDLVKDEAVEIDADLVVNAAGAWAGKIAGTAGIHIQIIPGKGTMVAINHRVLNTVVNRCKMPADGDIIVPIHTVAIIGTTDEPVADPENLLIEPWEVSLMLEEGEKLIPGLKNMRMLRAWAGVRPLYNETKPSTTREISRAYVLLDHEERDGLSGLITITSGKWTTYRLMAEATVDLVGKKLGVRRSCRTHLEALPGAEKGYYHHLGARLAQIEKDAAFNTLVCECELATQADIITAIVDKEAKTLDDIRRDARLGMGPCQGGFCTYRSAGILQAIRHPPVEEINLALRDFLQERWKGLLSILWGQQLRQERLDELIYLNVLNVDHLPASRSSRLAAEVYSIPEGSGRIPGEPKQRTKSEERVNEIEHLPSIAGQSHSDVLVIGAGLSGLVAAWQASARGRSTILITQGWGATHWHSGCIDVIGYLPNGNQEPVQSPIEALEIFLREHPDHPYAKTGLETLNEAIASFKWLCADNDYPLHGTLEHNWLLPSAVGAFRPSCLIPETMITGDLRLHDPMLIVGFDGFPDFYPGLIVENLKGQDIPANEIVLDLPSLRNRRFVLPLILARLFDTEEFRAEVIAALKPKLGECDRIGFPAILGLERSKEARQDLEMRLNCPIFEIPTLPPSIPGIRLHNLLLKVIQKNGGTVYNGMQAAAYESENSRINGVWSEAASRRKYHPAKNFILATGGILGGGITGNPDGNVHEMVLNLPLTSPIEHHDWFKPHFFDPLGHPIYQSGIPVNSMLQPLNKRGQVVFSNLFAAGTALAGGDFLRERSLEGIALTTGFKVGEMIE